MLLTFVTTNSKKDMFVIIIYEKKALVKSKDQMSLTFSFSWRNCLRVQRQPDSAAPHQSWCLGW